MINKLSGSSAIWVAAVVAVAVGVRAEAQSGPSVVTGLAKVAADRLGSVLAAAEQMPAGDYTFQPAEGTRSFGALVAHVADTNRAFCSAIGGAREPVGFEIEKTVHDKTAIVQHLKESIATCTRALGALTDATLLTPVSFGGGALIDGTSIPVSELPPALLVTLLTGHTEREYGKLTIYLRAKGLVPPTSQPRAQ